MDITVTLLGTPSIMIDGVKAHIPYRKAEGLFYFLCINRSVSRDEAVGVLWADATESAARKNLRDAIYNLRKLFGDSVISTEGNNRIILREENLSFIDYDKLTDKNILSQYTSEFLQYFYIKNCIEFEEWVSGIRTDLMRRYSTALEHKIDFAIQNNDNKMLSDCAYDMFRKHLYEEPLFREIIHSLIQSGDSFTANRLYQTYKSLLLEDLGMEPEEKTTLLVQSIPKQKETVPSGVLLSTDEEYFFGRKKELDILLSNLSDYSSGKPATSILLIGEAGVGKTATLRQLELTLRASQYIVLSYQCVQTEQELYLRPWIDILKQAIHYCEILHVPPACAPTIYNQEANESFFSTQYEMYAETTLELLANHAGNKKIVLFLDDVQWMDEASKRLMCNLIYRMRNQDLLIILTCRNDCESTMLPLRAPLLSKGLLREITLSCFSLEETKQIISECTPILLDEKQTWKQIYYNTTGNALFLTELLKEIAHGGSLNQLPSKVTSMIQSRLASLSPENQKLLEAIALFPRLATMEELIILTEQSRLELAKGLEQLLALQLIRQSKTSDKIGYGFLHQVIRDYIYDTMLVDKRMALHLIAAEYYEKEYAKTGDNNLCPMLIYHFDQGANTYKAYTYRLEYLKTFYAVQHEIYPTILTESWKDYYAPKMDNGEELHILSDKIRTLNKDIPESAPLHMKLAFLLGRYELFSGSFEQGLINIHKSIALAKKLNDQDYLMENYLQMVFHAIQIHNLKMFHSYISACEELLTAYTYSEATICAVLRLRGVYYMKNYLYDKAEAVFNRIIQRLEPLCKDSSAYQISLAACYNYIGEGRQVKGDMSSALQYYFHAIQCCDENCMVNGIGIFYANAGSVLYKQGHLKQAQEYIDKASQYVTHNGAMWGQVKVKCYAALLAIKRGDWADAEQYYKTAKETTRKSGNPTLLSLLLEVERLLESHNKGIALHEV